MDFGPDFGLDFGLGFGPDFGRDFALEFCQDLGPHFNQDFDLYFDLDLTWTLARSWARILAQTSAGHTSPQCMIALVPKIFLPGELLGISILSFSRGCIFQKCSPQCMVLLV